MRRVALEPAWLLTNSSRKFTCSSSLPQSSVSSHTAGPDVKDEIVEDTALDPLIEEDDDDANEVFEPGDNDVELVP